MFFVFYLYTEDSKSGFQFWRFICENLFSGIIDVRNLGDKSNSTRLAEFMFHCLVSKQFSLMTMKSIIE